MSAATVIIKAMIIQEGSNPADESANPLQVINWICQTAKKILSVMQELNFSKNILLYQYQEYTDLLMINFH